MPGQQKDSNVNQFNKFLENNHDFLQEKYLEYFKKKPIPIKDLSKQAAIKYIYDVFSFQKYEQDPKMNDTLRTSLIKNIQDFSAILAKQKKQIDDTTAVEMLKFCIENNQMFAVKYDKKDKKMKTEEKPEQEAESPKKQENDEIKEQKQHEQSQQKNEQQPQKGEDEEKKQNQQQQPLEEENNLGMTNQFGIDEASPKKIDTAMIKKNLKIMFEFYCRQQQNVGANTTFDRINHQCHTMTLGKFLSFCLVAELKNDKIDKSLILRKYKMIAQGKKEIQFQQFYELVQILAGIDDSIIPKLGVDDRTTFKTKMKERLKAFNTQDTTSRDIRRDGVFIPKLTAHSGKPSDALAQEMKLRKLSKTSAHNHQGSRQSKIGLNYKQITKTPNQNQQSRYNISSIKQSNLKDISQIMTPKDVTSSQIRDFEEDLSFLDKMINVEENDEEWLKDYKIPTKRKIPFPPPMLPSSALPPRLNPRKQSIVPNIKKRVEEIQKTETRQSMHIQRRKFNQNYRTRNSNSILK